ncbi:MAG: hypothetical protein FJ356_05705 [Thaumarchaeota archaeon]|nr:hypothetical protein [Nitrososphaerota archaeon]
MDLSQLDPTIISAIIVGIPTSILTIITFLYMHETRLIRKSVYEPNFSISPITYMIAEDQIHQLALINSGQTAKAIEVNCEWTKVVHKEKTFHNYYIVSLGSNDTSILYEIPISDIVKAKGVLTMQIKCKDSRNKDYITILDLDFEKIEKQNMTIAYQRDNQSKISTELYEIRRALQDIERKLSHIR